MQKEEKRKAKVYLPLASSGHPGSDVQFVWKIFLIALGLRLGFVLLYPQLPLGYDALMYDELGWNLAKGKGFVGGFTGSTIGSPDVPEVGVGPIYPAFLALIYLTFKHHLIAVRIVQAFLSAAVILVLYPKVREAFGSEIAKLSAVLIGLYPAFTIYPGILLTETLFLFFLAILIWALISAVQSDSAWRWVFAGGVMGGTILLRQETLVMVPVFAGLILWQCPRAGLIRKLSLFLLVTVLSVGIWTIRNYLVFDEVIVVSAHGGDTLWISTKGWTEWHDEDPDFQSLVQGLNYIKRNNVLRKEGITNIVRDPLNYLLLCVKRLPHFWITSHTAYLAGLTNTYQHYYMHGAFGKLFAKIVLIGANLALIFMGVWGAFISLKAQRESRGLSLFFLVPIVVIALTHFFLFAAPRYQVPTMPFILVFAATWLDRFCVIQGPPLFKWQNGGKERPLGLR